jgi:hypothetical protein
MRVQIVGEGANARHAHPLGELDLVLQPEAVVAEDGVAIALHCEPRRAIQVKRAETRITLSVAEVFALFHDVTAGLGLGPEEVAARLEAVRRARAASPASAAAPPVAVLPTAARQEA